MGASGELVADMVEEILLRLPVESLLRFKSVSKQWRDLISSSRFATAHHRRQHSTAHPSVSCLLSYATHDQDWNRSSTEVDPGVTLISGGEEGGGIRAFDLDVPPLIITSEESKTIVGCGKGLVCIRSDVEGMLNYLWNPATRQYRRLPPPLFGPTSLMLESEEVTNVILGFGCTANENDCKLLRIVVVYRYDDGRWLTSKAEIFSLSSGLWTQVKDVRKPVPERYPQTSSAGACVVLKGVLYRLVKKPVLLSSRLIQSFDFEDEVFGTIDAPPDPSCCNGELVVCKESLAMLSAHRKVNPMGCFCEIEMWVLMEGEGNDNHRRWTKLFTCKPPGSSFPNALGNWQLSETLFLFQNAKREGVQVTCDDPCVLYLFDPLLQKVKKFITSYKRRLFGRGAHCFVPSLVSVYAQHEVNTCIPHIVPQQSRFVRL